MYTVNKKPGPGVWKLLCWRQRRVLSRIQADNKFARLDKAAVRAVRDEFWPHNWQTWVYAFYVNPATGKWMCRLTIDRNSYDRGQWTYSSTDRDFWRYLFDIPANELEQAYRKLKKSR